jgi:putative RNA 2'-phosphotransferase
MAADLTRLSRRLSYVLRHAPDSIGVALDPQGWAGVDDLLAALTEHGVRISRTELDAVVAGSDKRRFALRDGPDGRPQIRANQGHSVPVDLGLDVVPPPAVLFHGTSTVALQAIRLEGLHRGRRHHVHLSRDAATAHRVGSRRRGTVAILAVDAAAMAADGYLFYRSANGVWLTEWVPPHYLTEIADSSSDQVGV